MAGILRVACDLPLSNATVQTALQEAFRRLQGHVRNHTLGCRVPATFIAGAATTSLSRQAVLRHLGSTSPKPRQVGMATLTSRAFGTPV